MFYLTQYQSEHALGPVLGQLVDVKSDYYSFLVEQCRGHERVTGVVRNLQLESDYTITIID